MNRDLESIRLPEPVERYFREVAAMQPPADLLDDVIDRIEATPRQPRSISTFALPVAAALLAVAVIGAGAWAFSPAGPVGTLMTGTDASPTPTPTGTPIPTAASPDLDALPDVPYPTREVTGFDAYPIRAEGHGSLWMTMWDLNTVVRWDPATGEEQARIPFGSLSGGTRDHRDAAILVTDERVYAGAAGDRVMAIDPATNEAAEFATDVRPTDLATDGETLWAVDLHHDEVVRFDLATGEEIARILMPDQPSKIDLDADGDAWVVSPEGILVRIDAETNDIAAEYLIGPAATFLDVVEDAIYVSGGFRPVERFSIGEEHVVRRGGQVAQVQLIGQELVGFHRDGHLVFLDPETLEWRAAMEVAPFSAAVIVTSDDGFWFSGNGEPNLGIFVDTR